jgi:cell division protein FtsB
MHSPRISRSRIVFFVCLLIGCYFVYGAIAGAIHNRQLEAERGRVEREVAALEAKKEHLTAIRAYVATDAYVEQQARRQLGYARDGEVPFVVISPALPEEEQPHGEWWERLFPR